ncbi:MAG: isochorismate synthase [Gemmatimonadaceae bacterium]
MQHSPDSGSPLPFPLASLMAEARARARSTGRRVLASWIERIGGGSLDPLGAIEGVLRGAEFDRSMATLAAESLMYWARPRERFILAGLGAAVVLGSVAAPPAAKAAEPADRFGPPDAAWSALLRGAVVHSPPATPAGAGPLLMGGFSFDPLRPRAAHWRDFPDALLVLPRFLLTVRGEESWITANLIVDADGGDRSTWAELDESRRLVTRLAREARAGAVPEAGEAELRVQGLRSAAAWRSLVGDAVDAIRNGSLEKVVLARAVRTEAARELDPFTALRHLAVTHPESHLFGFWRGESVFLGASPERLVRLDGRAVSASSLAGSAPRGATPQEDEELAADLLASPKDRAEHAVVRRVLCAALAELCDDVRALPEPSLLTLANVHHLHTNVSARLREGHTLLELVARLHPTPAVGGAPRDEALRWIRTHEQLDRGWYAAPVGWMGSGAGEFAVALRSGLLRGHEGWLFAGCGVVADSDPQAELEESEVKLRSMQGALERTALAELPATRGRASR